MSLHRLLSRRFHLSDHLEGHQKATAQAIKLRLEAGRKQPPIARSQNIKVRSPGSQRQSFQDAQGREQSGDPVFDADPLMNEIFALAMRSFVDLLADARRPDHATDLAISSERRRQDAQKALSIDSVGLDPPCASCDENASDPTHSYLAGWRVREPRPLSISAIKPIPAGCAPGLSIFAAPRRMGSQGPEEVALAIPAAGI
jgi:hypothetical protein